MKNYGNWIFKITTENSFVEVRLVSSKNTDYFYFNRLRKEWLITLLDGNPNDFRITEQNTRRTFWTV